MVGGPSSLFEEPWDLGDLEQGGARRQRHLALPDGRRSWTIGENIFAIIGTSEVNIVHRETGQSPGEGRVIARGRHNRNDAIGNDIVGGQIVSCALERYTTTMHEAVLESSSKELGRTITVSEILTASIGSWRTKIMLLLMVENKRLNLRVQTERYSGGVTMTEEFRTIRAYVNGQMQKDYALAMSMWRPKNTIAVAVGPRVRSAREIIAETAIIGAIAEINMSWYSRKNKTEKIRAGAITEVIATE